MALRDVIGQEKALNLLQGCMKKNRIPHALFFTGDEGIGKRLTAINFAKALNCHVRQSDSDSLFSPEESDSFDMSQSDACDTCPSCHKVDRGTHPDVFMIEPEGEGGQITVSSIRQLEASLSYKPFEGDWKVAIIDKADRLNPSAANAFLQTLEEPHPQSILILISSRPDMLLATIRSRCQRINFTPLPFDTMNDIVRGTFSTLDSGQVALLTTLSGGRLGIALNEDLFSRREWAFDMFEHMLTGIGEEVWENREAMEEWFNWAELWLRDIAVYKVTGQTDLLVNQDMESRIRDMADDAVLKDILKLSREIYNIKERLYFNLNKQLTFNYTSLLLKNRLHRGSS